MFNNKLKSVMGKVDGFIADLQAGIEDTKQQRSKTTDKIIDLNVKVANFDTDIKAGQALLANLTKLKG